MFRPWDIIYVLDFPILAFPLFKKLVKTRSPSFNKRASFAVTSLSAMLFSANAFLAEIDRPELLTWILNYYVVRARLAQPSLVAVPADLHVRTLKASQSRFEAGRKYVASHYAQPNPETFGLSLRDVMSSISAESFQQFLIIYKLKVDDKEYRSDPFYQLAHFK